FIDARPIGFWARWSEFIARRRVVVAVGAGAVMVALAIPFFSLQLGSSDQGSDPKSATTRSGYDLISKEFGIGYNSTIEAVVSGPGASDRSYLQHVSQTIATVPGVDRSSLGTLPLTKDVAFVSFKT